MSPEIRSSKTPHVMSLINSNPSGSNPYLPIDARRRREANLAHRNTVRDNGEVSKKVTLDINRMVIGELLEDTLERFNTCHCEKCRSVAEKLLLGSVSVRIVTVSGNGKRQTDEYFNCARKEIYSALVKLIIKNKRRPFHDMDI